jgi:hypothetical protein
VNTPGPVDRPWEGIDVATVHRARCKCGAFIKARPEVGDWAHEERAYRSDSDVLEDHDCPLVERTGVPQPEPEHKPRGGGRPASPSAKSRARMHRFLCACDPPILIRHARTELDAVCGVCSEAFIWSPTPREQGVALVMADA